MTQSELASILDISYRSVKTIGAHVKKEFKGIVLSIDYAIYNAMQEQRLAKQSPPYPYSLMEGSLTQQSMAIQSAKDILAKLETVNFPELEGRAKTNIDQAKAHLAELIEKTSPVENPENKVPEEQTDMEILEEEKKTDDGISSGENEGPGESEDNAE